MLIGSFPESILEFYQKIFSIVELSMASKSPTLVSSAARLLGKTYDTIGSSLGDNVYNALQTTFESIIDECTTPDVRSNLFNTCASILAYISKPIEYADTFFELIHNYSQTIPFLRRKETHQVVCDACITVFKCFSCLISTFYNDPVEIPLIAQKSKESFLFSKNSYIFNAIREVSEISKLSDDVFYEFLVLIESIMLVYGKVIVAKLHSISVTQMINKSLESHNSDITQKAKSVLKVLNSF